MRSAYARRGLLCISVLVALLAVSVASAAAAGISSDYLGGASGKADAEGRFVVWATSSSASRPDIKAYDRQTQTTFDVCTAVGYQLNPHVSGDLVVWDDFRGDGFNSPLTNPVIYAAVIDPDTHAVTEFALAGASTEGGQPCCDLSGAVAVWPASGGIQAAIIDAGRQTCDTFTVATSSGSPLKRPVISGNLVAWAAAEEGGPATSDIYSTTIDPAAKTAASPVAVCAEAEYQGEPAVSGDWIVWEDSRSPANSSAPAIRGKNIRTNARFGPLGASATGNAECRAPSVGGRYVVYLRKTHRPNQVMAYNLASRRGFLVAESSADGISALYSPSVNGAAVLWSDGDALRLGALLAAPPVVKAPYSAGVIRGRTATLRFKIVDSGVKLVKATITITNRRGKTVKTITAGNCACNKYLSRSFRCSLPVGRYTFKVTATDWCMNQASASNRLTVR